jgi:catechol 2,3-dioxygenase-like lactoylglutathione lyase family enzyme
MTKEASVRAAIVPSLLTTDLEQTLQFYGRLGFDVSGRNADGGDATWAEVCWADVRLQFYTDPPPGTPTQPGCSGTLYVGPVDVLERAAVIRRAGIPPAWGPELMDYGMREVAVQDPNGYFVAFTEPVDPGAVDRPQ